MELGDLFIDDNDKAWNLYFRISIQQKINRTLIKCNFSPKQF